MCAVRGVGAKKHVWWDRNSVERMCNHRLLAQQRDSSVVKQASSDMCCVWLPFCKRVRTPHATTEDFSWGPANSHMQCILVHIRLSRERAMLAPSQQNKKYSQRGIREEFYLPALITHDGIRSPWAPLTHGRPWPAPPPSPYSHLPPLAVLLAGVEGSGVREGAHKNFCYQWHFREGGGRGQPRVVCLDLKPIICKFGGVHVGCMECLFGLGKHCGA